MTRFTLRVVPLYITLLLALALIGGHNQHLYRRQLGLMDRKEALLVQLTDLRAAAARVSGPLAITTWAREQGMIPAPEGEQLIRVAPAPPPDTTPPDTGLELRTVWR